MANSKQKFPRITSPKLTLVWPKLFTPDTKFNADGEYATKGRLPAASAECIAFVKQLDAEVQKSLAAAQEANPKIASKIKAVAPYNDDHDEYPGDVVFNFKMKAIVRPKDKPEFTQKPAVFDSKALPLDPSTRIGGGSTGKVTFDAVPYYSAKDKTAGVTLRLVAAQIIDLKEYDGSLSASAYGFAVESDEAFDSIGEPLSDDAQSELADAGKDVDF